MKILFCMRNVGYVRNFESTLALLAERGHQVHIAFGARLGPKKRELIESQSGLVESLCATYPAITHGPAPDRDLDGWALLARQLRVTIDYLRYLEPAFANAPKLRARAAERVPRLARTIATSPVLRTERGRRALGGVLRQLEAAVPDRPKIAAFLGEQRPDVLLVTPLVESISEQADYVRVARQLGIRTGLCVASWDNLTTKGLIREPPDLVAVWNEPMKREAVELHGIPAENVVVTGAPVFDQWFDRAPSTTREAFCRRVGLPTDRPYVLYLCSSSFIAPREVAFVERWARALRAQADPRLAEAGVLIRPHPQNAWQWQDVDLSALGPVVVWPRAGATPIDALSKSDFYDSLYHCAAVIGINTSAQIEAGIVGRPVHTVLAPEFRETQDGTLHFQHLRHANGGLLRVAATLDEHVAQLADALAANGQPDRRGREFVQAFVRPLGLDVPATPVLVQAIEALARRPPLPSRAPGVMTRLLRPALLPIARFLRWKRTREQRREGLPPAAVQTRSTAAGWSATTTINGRAQGAPEPQPAGRGRSRDRATDG